MCLPSLRIMINSLITQAVLKGWKNQRALWRGGGVGGHRKSARGEEMQS